jgi:hypothetical protein
MYKIFKDKDRVFKCNVDVQGADIKDCKARLIIESELGIFMLRGEIDKSGICKIKIPKEKILNEGTVGNMTLEVIAESTVFEAWTGDFTVSFDKKVNVILEENSDGDIEDIDKEFNSNDNTTKVSATLIDDEDYSESQVVDIEEDEEDLNIENIPSSIEKQDNVILDEYKEQDKPIINKKIEKEEDTYIQNEGVMNFDSFLNRK